MQTKLDGNERAQFGASVAIYGDTVIIGAEWEDVKGYGSGSASIYTRVGNTWSLHTKLLPGDGEAGDNFGGSVAIDGDTVIVGATGNGDEYNGSVYIYIRVDNAWSLQTKLIPDDSYKYHHFGERVAIYGDNVIIGTPYDDVKGIDSGSAYIYTRDDNAWSFQTKLMPDDNEEFDDFGESIAIDGDTVVIGASGNNDKGKSSGSAYIYTREGNVWSLHAKLVPDDGDDGDNFGVSVAIDGDTLIVGANLDDDKGQSSGSSYVYSLEN